MKKIIKLIKYRFEYLAFRIIAWLLRRISIDNSASFCSFIAKLIARFLPSTKIARSNLKRFYGIKDQEEEDKIIESLWDNFGRFIGEFPHIHSLTIEDVKKRIEIIGLDNIKEYQDKGQPFLLFTGHFANWDFILRIAEILYPEFGIVYRSANNYLVDKLICKWRYRPNISLIPKGPGGARALIKSIKAKHSIAMLVDQRMSDGISVPFFGKPAMTAPAIAKFALQFNYPIIPMQIIRTQGSNFQVILHPALEIKSTNDQQTDILNIMKNINKILESWIRQHPAQWFWFHNRWGKN